MLPLASNQQAILQLLEAESNASILLEEGQGMERVLWEASGTKRQREMDIWAARCRALQQVYWSTGQDGSGGQVGSGCAAVEANQTNIAAIPVELGPGLAAV